MRRAKFMPNILENHDRKDNFVFYASQKGKEILNENNFPPTIQHFLASERTAIQKILTKMQLSYDALLELGCGNARNIDLALAAKLMYYGIDFIESEITLASIKIKEKNAQGKAKCLSIMDLNHQTTPIPPDTRTICLYPFNLFGNIFDPLKVIQISHELKYDLLVSTYREDTSITPIIDYYQACGLSNIKTNLVNNGVLFSSDQGFNSIIYKKNYLEQIAKKLHFDMKTFDFGTLGRLYYIHKHY